MKAFSLKYNEFELDIDVDAVTGIADTGNFQNDLIELILNLGNVARKSNKQVAFFIDEIQYLKEKDFEALIAAIHRVGQKNLPVIVFGAGLPKIAKFAGDAKSYAERLFKYVKIDSLVHPHDKEALEKPANKLDVIFEDKAVKEVLRVTERGLSLFYPRIWETYMGKQSRQQN